MNYRTRFAVKCLLALVVGGAALSCDSDPASELKGQTNTSLTFYGRVVDQDGHPLGGAQFEYRVEAYPEDWTFETRGRDNDVSTITVASGADGRFQFDVQGCKLIRTKAECEGYRLLFDRDGGGAAGTVDNRFYTLIAWGALWYRSDPQHPAVYVFVKEGVHEVSALPCRGGYDSGGGTQWRLNRRAWPKKPSLDDVVLKQPATQPKGMTRGTKE